MRKATLIREYHRHGFDELNGYWARLDDIEAGLAASSDSALSFVKGQIGRTLEKIRSFEPSVSVIGQVKAGKSTLLNALIGETELLPSDVNPWTSVITAIHLNSRHRPENTRALFRFFDALEWDRLVATGGRLGEIATRAGFATEADTVRRQVTEMRSATEERLGADFQGLLGSAHAFDSFNRDLLDRYICLGSGANDGQTTEGADPAPVYADVTKLADLYIDLPGYPRGLCLRDTPGVNDTFMMREQITLNAISESRVCVVVLSAHQALSTMDIALLRIICAVEAREVILFVNRIDELADPVGESERIRASIRKTLNRIGLGSQIEILFGSGYWANCALEAENRGDPADLSHMVPASQASLAAFWRAKGIDLANDDTPAGLRAIEASGVGELHRAIAHRVVQGPGQALLRDISGEIESIAAMSETVISVAQWQPEPGEKTAGEAGEDSTAAPGRKLRSSRSAVEARLAASNADVLTRYDTSALALRQDLETRLMRARDGFVDSALEALNSHVATFGEHENWSHDPSTLRMAMRSAYMNIGRQVQRLCAESLTEVMNGVQDLMLEDIGVYHQGDLNELPEPPVVKSPVVLAQVMSLDLQRPWWRKFWSFGGRNAAEKRYRALIEEETLPMVGELLSTSFDTLVAEGREIVAQQGVDQQGFVGAVLDYFDGSESGAAAGLASTLAALKQDVA